VAVHDAGSDFCLQVERPRRLFHNEKGFSLQHVGDDPLESFPVVAGRQYALLPTFDKNVDFLPEDEYPDVVGLLELLLEIFILETFSVAFLDMSDTFEK
jgi:hypothetical protein